MLPVAYPGINNSSSTNFKLLQTPYDQALSGHLPKSVSELQHINFFALAYVQLL